MNVYIALKCRYFTCNASKSVPKKYLEKEKIEDYSVIPFLLHANC